MEWLFRVLTGCVHGSVGDTTSAFACSCSLVLAFYPASVAWQYREDKLGLTVGLFPAGSLLEKEAWWALWKAHYQTIFRGAERPVASLLPCSTNPPTASCSQLREVPQAPWRNSHAIRLGPLVPHEACTSCAGSLQFTSPRAGTDPLLSLICLVLMIE